MEESDFRKILLRITGYALLSAVFLIPSHIRGAHRNHSAFETVFLLIYNQQFREAELRLANTSTELDPLQSAILSLDLAWWKAIADNDKESFTRLEKMLSQEIPELKNNSASAEIFELISLTYSLRLAALQQKYFTLLGNIMKISNLLDKTETSTFTAEELELFNIYKAIFDIGKSKIILFNGPMRKEGMLVLENSALSDDIVIRTIANYSLAKIYTDLEKTYEKAVVHYQYLSRLYPENRIFVHSLDECLRLSRKS